MSVAMTAVTTHRWAAYRLSTHFDQQPWMGRMSSARVGDPSLLNPPLVCPTAIGYCKGGTRGKVGAPLISLLTVVSLCLIPGGRGGLDGRPLAAGKTEIE